MPENPEQKYPMRSATLSYESADGEIMSLGEMHTYLTRLIEEGVSQSTPVYVRTKGTWSRHGPGVKRITVEEKSG